VNHEGNYFWSSPSGCFVTNLPASSKKEAVAALEAAALEAEPNEIMDEQRCFYRIVLQTGRCRPGSKGKCQLKIFF
jgi:hypothetical protein